MPADTLPNDNAHCYAVRRVNPFRGVYQIIETPAGRAISANGVVWDIEVCAGPDSSWGNLQTSDSQLAYIRYGLWSVDEGLVNRPLSPDMGDSLARQCHQLIAVIEASIGRLPFPLEDSDELWLFDSTGQQAIALLASKLPAQNPPSPEPRYWSASVGAQGVPSQHRFNDCDALEQQVRQRAGFNINKRWIARNSDGSGQDSKSADTLPAAHFPVFLVHEDWPDAQQATRVQQYIDWIAPSLLTLQRLGDERRQRLENNLYIQAISVEHHWQLYPRVIDEKRLKSARVQGRLQNSQIG